MKVWYIILDVKKTNMNMGLVNSHIAHWMQLLAGNSIRNVSLGTPRTMDVCLNVILLHVMF